jgi:hypothetical protein
MNVISTERKRKKGEEERGRGGEDERMRKFTLGPNFLPICHRGSCSFNVGHKK